MGQIAHTNPRRAGNDDAPYVDQDGTECGNTPSNYANGGCSVSDPDYDYFYSAKEGGLCRAKKGSSEVDAIIPASSLSSTTRLEVNQLNKDGDTLYCVVWDGNRYAIRSAKTDGSDLAELYSVQGYDSGKGFYYQIHGLCIYDHTLYFILESMTGASSLAEHYFDLYSMGEDGSIQQKLSGLELTGSATPYVAKDKVYFVYTNPGNANKSSGGSSILSENLDGSDQETIYTCSLAFINGNIILQDGSIYVLENGLAASSSSNYEYQLTRMDPSGGNQSVLLSDSISARSYVGLAGIARDTIYIGKYGDGVLSSFKTVPLAGGDPSDVDVDFTGINAKLMNACDCLLVYGTDTAAASGARVARIGFDGTTYRQLIS